MSRSEDQALTLSSKSMLTECQNFWSAALEQRVSRLQTARPLTAAGRYNLFAWQTEISVLEGLIATARVRQNALTPCSALPPEILSRIFEYVQIAFAQSAHTYFQTSRWVAITSVCKYWRDVAIGHGKLWSTISTESKQPWPLFLQRAGKNSLSISAFLAKYSSISPSDEEYSQYIAKHLHHVHKLLLSSGDASIISSILSNTAVAPNLQTLDLAHDVYDGSILPVAANNPSSAILSCFLESAPSLRDIEFIGCAFPWRANIANLRTLNIHSPSAHSRQLTEIATTAEILRFLSRNTKLESLMLLCLPMMSFGTADSDEIITLPSLISLYLSGEFASCLSIWRNIQPHPLASIHILPDDNGAVVEENKILDVFSILSRFMASPNHPPIIRANICIGVPSWLVLWTTSSLPDTLDTTLKTSRRLIVRLDIRGLVSQSAFKSFYSQLPLHAIEGLTIEAAPSWPKEEWSSFFIATKSLKTVSFIRLSGESMVSLCSALTPAHVPRKRSKNKSRKEAQRPRAPLPHLECLKLVDMDLRGPGLRDNLAYTSLTRTLKARKAIHSGPQVLDTDGCTFTQIQISQVEQIIRKVECDGSFGASDDEEEDLREYDEDY